MEVGFLSVVILDNGEIMFNGRSLGFITKEEFSRYFARKEIFINNID